MLTSSAINTAFRNSLLFLLLMVSSGLLGPKAHAITISTTTLTGPSNIPVGSSAEFTLTITGTGAGTDFGTALLYTIYDQDPGNSDPEDNQVLIDETGINVFGVGANGDFNYSTKFNLLAVLRKNEPQIRGKDGTSDETNAEVFALIEARFSGSNLGTSSTLTVTAVPVPEPNMISLVGLLLVLLAAVRRSTMRPSLARLVSTITA